MPYCAVYGCSATPDNEKERSFHHFPKDPKLRKSWVIKLKREDFVPSQTACVCSYHFNEEDYSRKRSSDRPVEFQRKRVLRKGAIPSYNLRGMPRDDRISLRQTQTSLQAIRKMSADELLPCSSVSVQEMSVPSNILESELNPEDPHLAIQKLKMELETSQNTIRDLKARLVTYESLNPDGIKNFTGLDKEVFVVIVETIERFQPLKYWSGKTVNSVNSFNQLLIFLMKLKFDTPYFFIGKQFGFSSTTIQNIFLTYLHAFHEIFFVGCLDKLPSPQKHHCTAPCSFDTVKNCRIIIDCTEFIIETPRTDLDAAAVSFSNYKRRLTAKYLVGVAPNGAVTFVSDGYPGSTSDKVATGQSKVLGSLQAGDLILADKGFVIHDLIPRGVSLNLPPFLSGKDQFTKEEAKFCQKIARCRIHVERAIERIRNYKILNLITAKLRPYADKLVQVCAVLVNFQSPIIGGVFDPYFNMICDRDKPSIQNFQCHNLSIDTTEKEILSSASLIWRYECSAGLPSAVDK